MPTQIRPNILVLMSDQHSKHMLGCYGNSIVRTPNLDRLAAGGLRFTNAYCPSPHCVPSRMSFMTARTPSHNRVWNNMHVLSSGIPTWAHALSVAGYETSLIGRMHFVGPDQRHGFAARPLGEFHARHPGAAPSGGPVWTRFPAMTSGQARVAVETAGRGRTHYQWFDEQVADATCAYLRRKAQGDGQPFAAVAGFVLPHCPFVAPRELFDYYYQAVDLPEVEASLPLTIQRWQRVRGLTDPPMDAERIRVARAAYFALCEQFDRMVGQVLDCLEESGLAENTLVVYVSDHGEMAGEHGCWWKCTYYEGSAGIPMILRGPGVTARGESCDAACNLIDLGPTFADVAGAEALRHVDGRSLAPLFAGQKPADWCNETFSEHVDQHRGHPPTASRMIRSEQWKLWVHDDEDGLPPALFDLASDPGETVDLASDPAYANVRARLLARVYRDWDPEYARREADDASEAYRVLAAWGAKVNPPAEDALAYPTSGVEEDIELL